MADTTDKPKATLYWLELSRAQRIVWLLEECKDLPYDVKVYKRGKDKLAPEELKKIHPLGKSPVISIQASAGAQPLVIAESGTITEYLCEYFAPHLIPKRYKEGQEGKLTGETEEWLRYRYFMHYAEGSLMTLLLIGLFVDEIRNAPIPFFLKPITRTIASRVDDAFLLRNQKTQFSFLESQVASSPNGGEYLCGKDLTGADILLSFPLIAAKTRYGLKEYPKLLAYIEKLEKNEVHQRSIKRIEADTGEKFKSNF